MASVIISLLGHVFLIEMNLMKSKFLLILILLMLVSACTPKVDYGATYTAFWTALPSDTPIPSETPTREPTATLTITPSPTDNITETPTETPTETVTPTVALTARLIWPRAKFGPEHVTWRTSSCPTEGNRLSCEFEYRKDDFGCYVGGTCYDDCGWFYSITTIPPGVTEFSSPCW